MTASRERASAHGRARADAARNGRASSRGSTARGQRTYSSAAGSGSRDSGRDRRRGGEDTRVSAHERQQKDRERRQSREDRLNGARGWAYGHRRILICLAVVLVVVVSLAGPIRGYYVARRQSEDLQAYYDQISEQNATLDEDVHRLTTEDGVKDEARKRGYVEEGETSVEVEGLPEDDDSSQQQTDTDTRSGLTRFLDAFFGYTPKSYD